jgi:hypothetical protein
MDGPRATTAPTAALAATTLPLWRRLLPFLVATTLIAFVVSRLNLGRFVEQLQRVNYVALLSFAVVVTLLLISADTFASVGLYERTVGRISFRRFFVIRSASYLPSLLNHHVGQAWLTYFISRACRAPLWRVAGATLLAYATTLGCLLLFAIVGLPANTGEMPWLASVVAIATILALLYLVIIWIAPRFLRASQTTAVLAEVGVVGHLRALAYRVPHMVVLFLGTWLPFRFFGVDIPFTRALVMMPPVMLVAALPITPQGLGSRDLLCAQLFARYATGSLEERRAAIVATTLTWICALTLVQLAISIIFMRNARRTLDASR